MSIQQIFQHSCVGDDRAYSIELGRSDLLSAFHSLFSAKKNELKLIVISKPLRVQLTAASSPSGEKWWFDVITPEPSIHNLGEYPLKLGKEHFICREFEVSLSYPSILRRQRRFSKNIPEEQNIICLPERLASSVVGLCDTCSQASKTNKTTELSKRAAAIFAELGDSITGFESISLETEFLH